MTLGAFKPRTKKDANGVRHVVEWHTGVPDVIRGGRVIEHKPVPGDEISDHVIIRDIGRNLVPDPDPVFKRPVHIPLEAQQIGPELKVMRRVGHVVRQQLPDESGIVVGIRCVKKPVRFFDGGNAANNRQIGSAKKLII